MPGALTSTAIQLNRGEVNLLATAQIDGLKRGMILLSKLNFDWKAAAKGGAKSGLKIKAKEEAKEHKDEIKSFLAAAWQKASGRASSDDNVKKSSSILGLSVPEVLSHAKSVILSNDLIKEIVPFWGAFSAGVKGLKGVLATRDLHSSLDELKRMAPVMAQGFPGTAMDAFQTFARNEYIRSAALTAYNFGKGIAKLLITIFAAPVASLVNFVTSVVEAILSFCYTVLQGALFSRATNKARICVEERKLMSVTDFRDVLSGSPYVGAVFFAAANYIGHFQLTGLLSSSHNVISTNSLMDGVGKVGQTQRLACQYVKSSVFEVGFRNATDKEEFGWILEMIKGGGDTSRRSQILTKNATRWERFKHTVKRIRS